MSSKINKKWFVDRLEDIGESQASLARFLEVDRSSVSLLLAGRRRFQMDTAEQVARFLKVPVEDVLENAGLNIRRHAEPARKIRLVGIVDDKMVVHALTQGGEVDGHAGLPPDTVALRMQTASSELDWMDGWVLFYQPSRAADPAMAPGLCVVETSQGRRLVGNVRRGYASGTHNLISAGEIRENLDITSASPVLWVRP